MAATLEIHNALSHQRPPTPLGILGKFPPEVRNQLYQEIFHEGKAILTSLWPWYYFYESRPNYAFGILTASKTMRTEAEPYFYRYCQFSFDQYIQRVTDVNSKSQRLHQKLPRMHNVLLKAHPIGGSWPRAERHEQIAHILVNDGDLLEFADAFEDAAFEGSEMVFCIACDWYMLSGGWQFTSVTALQAVFKPFQRYEVVRLSIKVRLFEPDHNHEWGVKFSKCQLLSKELQDGVEAVLGPGSTVLKTDGPSVYVDCTEFHPRSYFEAETRKEEKQ